MRPEIKNGKAVFSCGCSFEYNDGIDFDPVNPPECPLVWELFAKGDTKGVFQLESHLGRSYSKKLAPENLSHLSALIAVLRPGCLKSYVTVGTYKDKNGEEKERKVNIAELYCLRKNGKEKIEVFDPSVEEILRESFQLMIYQEHAIKIARKVAGFSELEAEGLRKAVGKKLSEEMAKVKIKFLEGCEKTGLISKERAEELFGWIENSQRYSFNASHSYGYANNSYRSAYIKSHFPIEFYQSWLTYAQDKPDPQLEIKILANDAKLHDIEVYPPSIFHPDSFSTDGKDIYFGIGDIKGIGPSKLEALKQSLRKLNKDCTSLEVFKSGAAPSLLEKLIKVGALKHTGKSRLALMAELKVWIELIKSKPKLKFIEESQERELIPLLRAMAKLKESGGVCRTVSDIESLEGKINILENPIASTVDTTGEIAYNEEDLLGISLTCSAIDDKDLQDANTTCRDFLTGKDGYLVFAVSIDSVKEITVKNGNSKGQKMARVMFSDSSGAIECTVFPDRYKQFGNFLVEGTTAIIRCSRDKKDKDQLILEEVKQL